MFHFRKMQFVVIAAAALCFAAASFAATNVTYTAAGTFATPALKGNDGFLLAGFPFSIGMVVAEGTKPIKHTMTSATYANIPVTGFVDSGLLSGGMVLKPSGTIANLSLSVGATGQPDTFSLSFPVNGGVLGLPITFNGKVTMPAGTIKTPAIKPFTRTVSLTPTDGSLTYTCTGGPTICDAGGADYDSTTLGFASGTLSAK
jgi:hypothetical protein